MRPHVLLIVLDTARADAMEPYGAPPGTTPALAQLAADGRALPGVHATACWTMPSHASMFTGLLPRSAGLSRAPGGMPPGCRPVLEALSDRLLPEVLRRSGYRTRGVSTNVWVATESGFATGFDDFRDIEPKRAMQMISTQPRPRARWALDALRAGSDDGAAEAGAVLRSWFADSGDEPQFWFVNLIECHSPYLPPKPWNDLGPLDRIRAAEEARRHLTLSEIWRVCVSDFDVPDDALERMRHLYDRSVRQLDAWVGDTLAALEDAGKRDDTLVLICADHGENLGEGGLLGHAYSLDERLLHVPFIAAGPGAPVAMASLAELPRVIAEAAGLEEYPWDRDPVGVAVAQFDPPGGGRDDPRKRAAVKAWGAGAETLERLSTPMTCAVAGGTKLLLRGDQLELFDLAGDPLEERARRAGRGEVPSDLLAAIEDQAGPSPASPASDAAASPEELARIEDRMRTLGYL
jgi:arylsulfatase A-like enzyme